MLIDARSLPVGHRLHAEICIVGAGAAGLTLARELESKGRRVIVLESGTMSPRHEMQRLYEGAISGRPYYALDACRLRCLGGTTNFWGGWCHPFDAIDFEPREWMPGSGWPICRRDLDPAFVRAAEICAQPKAIVRPGDGNDLMPPLLDLDGGRFEHVRFRIQPVRFGERHRPLLERSRHADLVFHANALELLMDRDNARVKAVRVATLSGRGLSVSADTIVLASGGIENARLLLASQSADRRGVGNAHDLVGRYFIDHLHVPIGMLRPAARLSPLYGEHRIDGAVMRSGISLSEECRRREQRPGFAVTFHDADDPHDVLSPALARQSYRSLGYLAKSLRRFERPDRMLHHTANVLFNLPEVASLAYRRLARKPGRRFIIGCRAEQTPHPESRVTLDERRDTFGMPRARLHWHVSASDLRAIADAQQLLAEALPPGQFEMFPFRSNDGSAWPTTMTAGAHHMGTTRMHRDPRHGVVDEWSRVHGIDNLYVAGSSVFPTGGWAPPTLTIIAMAIRLADHFAGAGR